MIAVFKREFGAYFKGIPGYLFTAFLVLFTGVYVMVNNLSGFTASFEYSLKSVSFIYMVAVPVLTMRSLAEEKKQKTDQLLYALPLRMSSVVLGKYLAMVAVLLVPCVIIGVYPLILTRWGNVNLLMAYNGLFSFFLLGAALLSVGLFISSMTENQVASAVITLLVMLVMYLQSDLASYMSPLSRASFIALAISIALVFFLIYLLSRSLTVCAGLGTLGILALYLYYHFEPLPFYGGFANVLRKLGLFDRFYAQLNGVFDAGHVVYLLSVIVLFLFLTVQSMQKRRWAE